MSIQNNKILTSTLFTLIGFLGSAQTDGPPIPQARGVPPTPPGAPIDNGLILLFGAAMIYGIYKILKLSKKRHV